MGAANDRIAKPKGKWYSRSKRRLWWVMETGLASVQASVGRVDSHILQGLNTDRWEIGRLTASCVQDARQGIRELQRASEPGLSEVGRSAPMAMALPPKGEARCNHWCSREGNLNSNVASPMSVVPVRMRCLSLAAVCFRFPKS